MTYFIQKPFENWTRHSTSIIGSVFLSLDYIREKLVVFLQQNYPEALPRQRAEFVGTSGPPDHGLPAHD